MVTADPDGAMTYHAEQIRRFGIADPRAIGYSERATQLARFAVIGAFVQTGDSILDAGSGTGDLYAYLTQQRAGCEGPGICYLGIEQQAEFVNEARSRFAGNAQCRFDHCDFTRAQLPQHDVVIACGSLNYRAPPGSDHRTTIGRLFAAAGRLCVFNMLDSTRMFPGEVIVGHNPDEILAHCGAHCRHVAMVRGYLSYDFTIAMARDALPDGAFKRLASLPNVLTLVR